MQSEADATHHRVVECVCHVRLFVPAPAVIVHHSMFDRKLDVALSWLALRGMVHPQAVMATAAVALGQCLGTQARIGSRRWTGNGQIRQGWMQDDGAEG